MITPATAADLVEALRAVVRTGRSMQHAQQHEEFPPAALALLASLQREGEQRLGRVADRLGVDPSVVSRQVAVLERAGLLHRRPDPRDGRAGLLAVTDKGDHCLHDQRARWADLVATALADWADDEVEALVAGLRRLTRDIRTARTLVAP